MNKITERILNLMKDFGFTKVFDVSMDFLVTGTKTIQDENQRVLKLQQTIIKLEKENERLKERNKILEKALKAFVTGEK